MGNHPGLPLRTNYGYRDRFLRAGIQGLPPIGSRYLIISGKYTAYGPFTADAVYSGSTPLSGRIVS